MDPVKLFISYAHKDEAFKKELVKHLTGLRRLKLIETWDDQKIDPGKEWENEIKKALNVADIVVFLISSDFVDSDYIHDVEIKTALEGYTERKQKILPVIVRHCDFSSSILSKFQALPDKPSTPVNKWENQDEAWYNVTLGIKKVIYEIRGEPMPDNETDSKIDFGNSKKITLHDFHQYTCDRRQQHEEFIENYEVKQNNKVQFYYILGKEVQSHDGLVNLLARDCGGYLQGIPNPPLVFIREIRFQNIGKINQLKIALAIEILALFEIGINDKKSILDKKLEYVCFESPVIKNMTKSDYVSILIRIPENEWDEEEIPELIRWFVSEFCSSSLPENAPTFLFYLGIIYNNCDANIIASVNKVVAESSLIKNGIIKPLPELTMVSRVDVERWFTKYGGLIAYDVIERQKYMDIYFPNGEEFEMIIIQRELKKIIDQFNKPTL